MSFVLQLFKSPLIKICFCFVVLFTYACAVPCPQRAEWYGIKESQIPSYMTCSNNTVTVTENQSKSLAGTVLHKFTDSMLTQCQIKNGTGPLNNAKTYDGLFCPSTFDGFACWVEALPSTTLYQYCVFYVYGFRSERIAHKTCTENGTWLTHPNSHYISPDYANCVDNDDWQFQNLVNIFYIIGYTISAASLVIAIFIFMYFRTLNGARARVHINLFISVILNNATWIIWYLMVASKPLIIQENPGWCQYLHVVRLFFMISNYLWMICEGLFLHISLVVVFVQEKRMLRFLMAVGWGLPLPIITAYVLVNVFVYQEVERCWLSPSNAIWIVVAPVIITIPISAGYLLRVVIYLLTNIHPVNRNNRGAVRKALKAAVILIPLYGIHFMFLPVFPIKPSIVTKLYHVLAAVLTSMQGLSVAVLFCFTNDLVKRAITDRLARYRRQREAIALAGLTVRERVVQIRERAV